MSDKRFGRLVVGSGIVLSFFTIPHLIDDFLFGIPAEFGLSNQLAQTLGGVFTVALILVLIMASREHKAGYYGTAFMGAFLALAGILKHVPRMMLPGPYWSGWFSEMLIYGLIVSGMILFCLSIIVIRELKSQS
jgi:hypothetical protein